MKTILSLLLFVSSIACAQTPQMTTTFFDSTLDVVSLLNELKKKNIPYPLCTPRLKMNWYSQPQPVAKAELNGWILILNSPEPGISGLYRVVWFSKVVDAQTGAVQTWIEGRCVIR